MLSNLFGHSGFHRECRSGLDFSFDETCQVVFEKPHGCALMNVAGITRGLEIQQEADNRHGVHAVGRLVLHLHGGHFDNFVQLVRDVLFVPGTPLG